jgi:hypothetical protein
MPTRPLASTDSSLITDANGAYILTDDDAAQPLVTPKTGRLAIPNVPRIIPNASRLTSKARHVTACSTGASVIARSSGKAVFTRGGTRPLISQESPLIVG